MTERGGSGGAGVLGASPLKPGTVLADGTVIGEYIGRSSGALSFYGENPGFGRVVVKVLAPAIDPLLQARADWLTRLEQVRVPGVQRLFGRGLVGPRNYLVYEYVEGQSLRQFITRLRDAGHSVDLDGVLFLVRGAAQSLARLHVTAAHGVVTTDNLFVDAHGNVQVVNVGFGSLVLASSGGESPEFRDTAYLAPDVRRDPWSAVPASDVYSLATIMISLLAGQEAKRHELPGLAETVSARHPEFEALFRACLSDDPRGRPVDMGAFVAELDACTNGNAEPRLSTAEQDLEALVGEVPALDAPVLRHGGTGGDDPERWIVTVTGRDFGPYRYGEVLDELRADRIDEHARVLDLFSQESAALIDVPEFTDAVMEYLPERAKRRLAEQERRQEVVKQAKRTGATTVITASLAAIAGAALLVYTQLDSPPLPLDEMVEPFRHEFVVQAPTYVEIQADEELIASLFDFSEPVPDEPQRPGRSRSSDSEPGGDDLGEEPSLDDYVLSFDGNAPSRKLTSEEINGTIAANQSTVQRCFQQELRVNPRFRGVTVSWSIVPDGRTTSVRIEEHGPVTDDTTTCLRRAFRSMRFPPFNDVPMNVSVPFRLQ